MIAIKSYSKSKNSDGGATSGKTSAINLTVADAAKKLSETHSIWGQDFNGTQDVDGDLTTSGEVKASNGLSTQGMKIAKGTDKTTFTNGTLYQFDANVKAPKFLGDVEANNVDTNTLEATEADIDTLNVNSLYATLAEISTLLSDKITVDTLTVTKAAHFFSLIIDEIKSVGGQIILSPANATIDLVRTTGSGNYKCYFRAQIGDEKITNQFLANDQVVCQTFNVAEGTSYNVSNTFYWRLVMSKGRETIDGIDYHYVLLSGTDCAESSGIPQQGDKIVTLGNRNTTSRQNAIVLSAYNSEFLDMGINAPSLVQYSGINDYNLSTHRLNILSNGLNEFHGHFKIATGEDLDDVLNTPSYKISVDTLSISVSKEGVLSTNSITASLLKDIRGTVTSVTVVPSGYTFQYLKDGVSVTSYNAGTRITAYTNFTSTNKSLGCQLLKDGVVVESVSIPIVADGTDGEDAEFYKIRIESASTTVSIEDKLGIAITAEVWKIKGASQQRMNTDNFYMDMLSNAGDVIELNKNSTYFYYSNDSYKTHYSQQATQQKYYEVRLFQRGASKIDVFSPITVTFNAGSIFQVKDDAITAAVANVSGDIARIEMKADNVTSTVANMKVGGKNLLDDTEFLTYNDTQDTTWRNKGGTASKSYGYMNQYGIHAISKPSNVNQYGCLELAEQYLEYKLEPNKEYTFSFYAKGSYGISTDQGYAYRYKGRVTTYVYPNVGAEIADNAHTFMLSNKYQRYSYTFKTKADLDTTATFRLLFRLISEETSTYTYYSNAYICMPKLEEGNMATSWDTSEGDMKSIITQTANTIESQIVSESQINSMISQSTSNIKAEVYDELNQATGIDIANGSITLNADRTTINGNLSIRNSNEGLVVYNNSNNPSVIIQNKQIPSLSNLNQSVSSYKVCTDFAIDYGEPTDVEFDSEEINLGYFNVGDTLSVGGSCLLYYPSTSQPIPLSNTVYYSYHFLVSNKTTGTDSYISAVRNIYRTGDTMDGGNALTQYTLNITKAGNYSVMLVLHLCNEPTTLNYGAVWFSFWDKTVSAYTQIGTDGLVSVKGDNNYLYFGNDGFVARSYGYNGFRVSDYSIDEIISYNGSGDTLWGNRNSNLRCANGPAPISMNVVAGGTSQGTKNVIRADSDYYDCDVITLKNLSSEVWIKLPPPYYVNGKNYSGLSGKSLKIKNLTGQRCYVYIQDPGYKIYAPDSTSSASYYNIGNGAAELLWTGSEWLWFRCT